jgi:LysM domain.
MNEKLNFNDLEQVNGGAGAAFFTHIVQAGDTLSGIAKKYGCSVEKVFMNNRETIIETAKSHGVHCDKEEDYANYIYPGEVLYVPNFH